LREYKVSKNRNIKPALVYNLSIPVSGLYIILIVLTSTSFVAAVLGYIALGISFGLLQSLFRLEHPYRVAFLSTISAPVMAYSWFALESILVLLGLSLGFFVKTSAGGATSIPLSGNVITIDPLPYISRLGLPVGTAIYLVVLAILTIPFGLVGIVGRFFGTEVIPNLVNKVSNRKMAYQKQEGGILLELPASEEMKKARIAANTTIVAAIISALASILVAVLK
jgi:hypothetical protein